MSRRRKPVVIPCVICGGPGGDVCHRCSVRPWEDPKVKAWLYELGITDEPNNHQPKGINP